MRLLRRIASRHLVGLSLWSVLVTTAAPIADAHHNTGALFDMESEARIEGTLVRYDWRNPHLYIEVEAAGDDGEIATWRFEGRPLAFMRRLGWTRETLVVGDHVTVTTNPSRVPGRRTGFMADIAVDGREVPPLRGQAREERFARAAEIDHGRANDLAGTWVTEPSPIVEAIDDPEQLALTAAGEAAVEAFDEATMHPGLECIPSVAPIFMLVPDTKSIELTGSVVRIRGEFDGAERTIYLDGRASPGPTLHGHSIGHWEDGALVIETIDFSEHGMGLAFGLPSSSRKRLVEHLALEDDGRGLTYRFELTDPEYLAEPVMGELRWAYRPDVGFEMLPCSLDNSRQFLND